MRILAADIGGTNSRFGLFEAEAGGNVRKVFSKWLKTSHYNSFKELLNGFLSALNKDDLEGLRAASFAVAGPIERGFFSKPPNIPWGIDLHDLVLPVKKVKLLNDFAAQAYACRTPAVEGARQILAGIGDPSAPIACVGAGTGLGQACLIPVPGGGFIAASSEGSHTPFPFLDEEEIAYGRFLKARLKVPFAECDVVVSGRGLSLLHEYMTGDLLEPEEVTNRFKEGSPTIERMGSFYGRVCRNYVLQTVSFGGLYIAGGVAAKAPSLVLCQGFRREFCTSSTMGRILGKVPVYLNNNEESGLWGAAFAVYWEMVREK